MRCFYCKDEMTESTTTHVVDLKKCIVIIRNVPCLACPQCGETFYIDAVAERLDEIVQQVSSLMTEIAVIEYSSANVA